MEKNKEHSQQDELFKLLDKYWDKVIKPNFKIECRRSYGKPINDSKTLEGQIILPSSFSCYKNSDYYLDGKDKEFIHFTSIDTFLKIINNGYFLATQFSNHDDPMELLFAGNELSKVIDRKMINQLKKGIFSLSMCNYPPEKESFDMWRIYGNRGYGIGIVFSFFLMKNFGRILF